MKTVEIVYLFDFKSIQISEYRFKNEYLFSRYFVEYAGEMLLGKCTSSSSAKD